MMSSKNIFRSLACLPVCCQLAHRFARDLAGLYWIEQDCIEPDCIELNSTQLNTIGLDWIGLVWLSFRATVYPNGHVICICGLAICLLF